MEKRADQLIITGIKTSGPAAEQEMRYCYHQYREAILAYLQGQGANAEEAKDVFQEALLCFYENVKADKFKGESSLKTYLISIARFIWLNQQRRAGKLQQIKTQIPLDDIDEGHVQSYLQKERDQQLAQFMKLLSEACQKVLRYAFYEDWSAKQIAEAMSYKNEQIARNKKSKCLGRLKSLLTNNANWLAYFKSRSHE